MHLNHAFAILALGILSFSSAWAGFPFPAGEYRGESVCQSSRGLVDRDETKLIVSETALVSSHATERGEIRSELFALFNANGSFSLSGPGVARGEGYCIHPVFCHFEVTSERQGAWVHSEETLTMVDGVLHRIGSWTEQGANWICKATFPQFARTAP